MGERSHGAFARPASHLRLNVGRSSPLKRGLTLALLAYILCASATAEETDLDALLPIDTSVYLMGELPNGFAYWIRENKTPPGQVAMLLYIGSGSLAENPGQEGLARFVADLAASTAQRRTGRSIHAVTRLDHVAYALSLSDNRPGTVQDALRCLATIGFQLALSRDEIVRHRRASEGTRERLDLPQRIQRKFWPFLAPGSRLAERLSGSAERSAVTAAPRDVRSFYQECYRSDNAALLVCGDIRAKATEARIQGQFSAWKSHGEPKATHSSRIDFSMGPRIGVVTDPDLREARVGINCVLEPRPFRRVRHFRAGLIEYLATYVLKGRLLARAHASDAPFRRPKVTVGSFSGCCRLAKAEAVVGPERWRSALGELLLELHLAHLRGLQKGELDEAKESLIRAARQQARAQLLLRTSTVLHHMHDALSRGRKPMTVTQRLELIGHLLPTIGKGDVEDCIRRVFPFEHALVFATFPETDGLAVPTREEVLDVDRVAKTRADMLVRRRSATQEELLRRDEDADLGILCATLANGTRIRIRSMPSKNGKVYVKARLVGGILEETDSNHGITCACALAIASSSAASVTMPANRVKGVLGRNHLTLRGGPDGGSVAILLAGRASSLEAGLWLLRLLLTEPRIEPEALRQWKTDASRARVAMEADVSSRAGAAVDDLLSDGDVRLRPPTSEEIDALRLEAAQRWLDHIVRSAPLEVAIVGPVRRAPTLTLAQQLLGDLPRRPVHVPRFDALRRLHIAEGPLSQVLSVETTATQAVVHLGWHGAPHEDRKHVLVLAFASRLLGARLNRALTTERRLAEAVACTAVPESYYEGLGMIKTSFRTDPERAEEVANIARNVMRGILKQPPTATEMQETTQRMVRAVASQLRSPEFWAEVLSSLDTLGYRLSDWKDVTASVRAITRDDILSILPEYMTTARYFQVIVRPREAEDK